MSNKNMDLASDLLLPGEGRIAVVSITTSSAATDLAATAQLGSAVGARFVTMISDVGVYLLFGDSGVSADETATSGDTRAVYLPSGVYLHGKLPASGGTYVALKGEATGKLRAWISSGQ